MNRFTKAVFYVVSIVAALAFSGMSASIAPSAAETDVDVTNANTTLTGYQFVGFTSGTVTAGVGLQNMNYGCVKHYGATHPGVRMCYSDEYLRSSQPTAPPSYAWINPTIISVYYDSTSNHAVQVDVSGASAPFPYSLNCNTWTTTGTNAYGLVVATNILTTGAASHIAYVYCSYAFPVTCCAP